MCLQLCGRHPREQEGRGGVPRSLEICGEPGPHLCCLATYPSPTARVSCLSLVDPLRVFHLPTLWLQAFPLLRVCSSVLPLLSVHLSTAFQPSHPSLLPWVWLAPSPVPRPSPFLGPPLAAPLFPSLPIPSSRPPSHLPLLIFFLPDAHLPPAYSLGFLPCPLRSFWSLLFQSVLLRDFVPCVLLCTSVSVRLSLRFPHPPSLSLGVGPLSLAHLLGGLPSQPPFFPGKGGAPVRLGGGSPLPPALGRCAGAGGGAPRQAEEPLGGPSCFLSSSRLHTPAPAPAPPGPRPPSSLLRPRCAPGAPRPVRAARRGRSAAGPRSYFAESGRGCSPPDGAWLGARPGPRRPPGRGLPGSPLPTASRPHAPRASSTHKCQRTAAAPMLTAGRAGPGRAGPGRACGACGARGPPPTGGSPSAPSCRLRGQRSGSRPPSRRD